MPESVEYERGQLVDVISDQHQYFHGKKVALAGDPDQLIALTEFLLTLDMVPVHIVTGTPGKRFERRIRELTEHFRLHKQDHHSRRGLLLMVGQRRRMLDYLKATDKARYEALIARLGLRK